MTETPEPAYGAAADALFKSDLWFGFTSADGPTGWVTRARQKAAQIAVDAAAEPIHAAGVQAGREVAEARIAIAEEKLRGEIHEARNDAKKYASRYDELLDRMGQTDKDLYRIGFRDGQEVARGDSQEADR